MTIDHAVEAVKATIEKRALPNPDHTSGHFWQQAADGTLVLQRCTSCGQFQYYPRALCTACAGETEWVEASGRGTLHTFTVIRQNKSAAFADLSPYVVGIVELEEGVRMMSNIIGCEIDDVAIGMPLEVVLLKAADDVGLPFWGPTA